MKLKNKAITRGQLLGWRFPPFVNCRIQGRRRYSAVAFFALPAAMQKNAASFFYFAY